MELLETFSFTYFVTCRDLPDRPRLDYWTILLHVRRPLSVCWLRFDHHFISTSHHIAPFRSEMWRILRLMTPGQWSVIRRRLEVLQHYDLQSSEGSECNVNISPCSCVITLALLIRSVIPYQWFLSHCDPSHTELHLHHHYTSWHSLSSLITYHCLKLGWFNVPFTTRNVTVCVLIVLFSPRCSVHYWKSIVTPASGALSCKPWLTAICN